MADIYDRMHATALRLLTTYGFDVTLRKKAIGGGGYRPGNSTTNRPAPVESKRKVVVTDNPGNRIGQQYGKTNNPGNELHRSDKWLYMDANGPEPVLQDEVVMKGITYTIIDSQTIGPGGKDILYLLVLKR